MVKMASIVLLPGMNPHCAASAPRHGGGRGRAGTDAAGQDRRLASARTCRRGSRGRRVGSRGTARDGTGPVGRKRIDPGGLTDICTAVAQPPGRTSPARNPAAAANLPAASERSLQAVRSGTVRGVRRPRKLPETSGSTAHVQPRRGQCPDELPSSHCPGPEGRVTGREQLEAPLELRGIPERTRRIRETGS